MDDTAEGGLTQFWELFIMIPFYHDCLVLVYFVLSLFCTEFISY